MLHADGPQGGAINLHKGHTKHTTASLEAVRLRSGRAGAKGKGVTREDGSQKDTNGTGFYHVHLRLDGGNYPSVITCGVKLLSTNQQLS